MKKTFQNKCQMSRGFYPNVLVSRTYYRDKIARHTNEKIFFVVKEIIKDNVDVLNFCSKRSLNSTLVIYIQIKATVVYSCLKVINR